VKFEIDYTSTDRATALFIYHFEQRRSRFWVANVEKSP